MFNLINFDVNLLACTLHKKLSFPLRISLVHVTTNPQFPTDWSHLLKKALMENFISCAVKVSSMKKKQTNDLKISVNFQLQRKFTEDLPKYLEQLLFKKKFKSLFMAYTPQTAITCTKLTIKTLEQSVKHVQC